MRKDGACYLPHDASLSGHGNGAAGDETMLITTTQKLLASSKTTRGDCIAAGGELIEAGACYDHFRFEDGSVIAIPSRRQMHRIAFDDIDSAA
jgi:hypothetical protein